MSSSGWPANVRVVVISGAIAAGKSTLLHRLKNKFESVPTVHIFEEPVDEWAHNLKRMYAGEPSATQDLQLQIIGTYAVIKARILSIAARGGEHVCFVERSPNDSLDIFCKEAVSAGRMTEEESETCRILAGIVDWPASETYLISEPPSVCFDRMVERDRVSEREVPRSYIDRVCDRHAEFAAKHATPVLSSSEVLGVLLDSM